MGSGAKYGDVCVDNVRHCFTDNQICEHIYKIFTSTCEHARTGWLLMIWGRAVQTSLEPRKQDSHEPSEQLFHNVSHIFNCTNRNGHSACICAMINRWILGMVIFPLTSIDRVWDTDIPIMLGFPRDAWPYLLILCFDHGTYDLKPYTTRLLKSRYVSRGSPVDASRICRIWWICRIS